MIESLGIEIPTKSTTQPATAGAMLDLLRRHYLPDESRPAGVFAPEIQAPGPVQRRADLIWLGCTAAAGNALVGHEVKVSRQDVLTELADLTKSDPWQRYCNAWYLVVPHESLIQGLDLPESWGVMLPPSGRRTRSMTVWRKAPALRPAEQGPALKTLAAWQCWRLRDQHNQFTALEGQNDRLRESLDGLRRVTPTVHPNPTRDLVDGIVKQLGSTNDGETLQGSWPAGSVTAEEVVEALRDLQDVRGKYQAAQRTLATVRTGIVGYQRALARAVSDLDRKNGE